MRRFGSDCWFHRRVGVALLADQIEEVTLTTESSINGRGGSTGWARGRIDVDTRSVFSAVGTWN